MLLSMDIKEGFVCLFVVIVVFCFYFFLQMMDNLGGTVEAGGDLLVVEIR